jgi:hypothetical protein
MPLKETSIPHFFFPYHQPFQNGGHSNITQSVYIRDMSLVLFWVVIIFGLIKQISEEHAAFIFTKPKIRIILSSEYNMHLNLSVPLHLVSKPVNGELHMPPLPLL